MSQASVTRTLPARAPDGWWTGHTRYRNYVLFAMTGFDLALASIVLLLAVRALAGGLAAWTEFLAMLASPPVMLVMLFILLGVGYFSIRFLIVGAKPLQVAIGPLPRPGAGLINTLHVGGVVSIGALLALLLLTAVIG